MSANCLGKAIEKRKDWNLHVVVDLSPWAKMNMHPSSPVPVLQGLVVVGLLLCCLMMLLYSQYRHPCRRKRGLYKTHKEKVSRPDQCVYDSIQVYLKAKHEIERDYKCRKPDPRYYDRTYFSSLYAYVPDGDLRNIKEYPRSPDRTFRTPPTAQHTFDTSDPLVWNLVQDVHNKELKSKCYSELLAKHPNSAVLRTHPKEYSQLGHDYNNIHNVGSCPKHEATYYYHNFAEKEGGTSY